LCCAEGPIVPEPAIEPAAAQGEDGIGPAHRPEHAAGLETRAENRLAAGLDHSPSGQQALAAELGVAQAFGVDLEVPGFGAQLPGHLGMGGIDGLFPLAEPVLLNPGRL
jgi:hypothetical protein